MKPRALVLRAAGTNCDPETAYAFELVGCGVDVRHVNELIEAPDGFADYRFLAIPGGFSYGDDVASGRIFANELIHRLGEEILAFVDRGGYAIGICNGFQVLVKSGLLPRLENKLEQVATLTDNANGVYTDRWVGLEPVNGRCAWIPDDEPFELPVAHAEGRFSAPPETLKQLEDGHQVALRYHPDDNFNGSDGAVAGICDPTGRVFGLMPHPERFLRWENHPEWTRLPRRREGDGLKIFRAAMRHAKES